jgi:hypothetical protein
MRWFRRNRKSCGALAFAALALQFVLSFAHVHVLRRWHSGQTAANVLVWKSAIVLRAPSKRSAPFQTEHDCDICASISLIATAKPASAPEIIVPQRVALAILGAPRGTTLPIARHVLAQSRAPPAV